MGHPSVTLNIFNDWYARDTSKKIRAVFKAKGQSGKPLSLPIYGYKKSEADKNMWLVDDEAAEAVFNNPEFGSVRTVCIDGEPWFVAKDISDILGYAQTSNMMKRIDEEDFISSNSSVNSLFLIGVLFCLFWCICTIFHFFGASQNNSVPP